MAVTSRRAVELAGAPNLGQTLLILVDPDLVTRQTFGENALGPSGPAVV
jgi:hypothetical protein